jgi:hypothetical protein
MDHARAAQIHHPQALRNNLLERPLKVSHDQLNGVAPVKELTAEHDHGSLGSTAVNTGKKK